MPGRKRITRDLAKIAETIRLSFTATDETREKTLHLCREITRHSANAIRAIHRREYVESKNILNSTLGLVKKLNREIIENCPDLQSAGFVHDSQKEFAEACITFSVITAEPIPGPKKLMITYPAYLNGLGEATGELRRYLLDSLRRNDFSNCEELLSAMDDIYTVLVTMDYPDAITYGLRRTTDSVRGILEKTRGDLTIALRQKELEKKLDLNNRKT